MEFASDAAIVCSQCGEAIARTSVQEQIDRLVTAGCGETAQHRVIRCAPLPEEAGAEGNP